MKTEISRFCDDCLQVFQPLPEALDTAAQCFEQSSDPALFRPPLTRLHDVRARLRSLVEKLRSQQAYLLIFGPLKSGKSTLMNAISGSYVSEVTSLPGYPCLVFVRHAETPHFSATRYNGRESAFPNGRVLKEVIADSHVALAQQISAAENRGEPFDPRRDFSEAIRRVDVKLPVRSLAESGTVLVDTPGLYSRMNFGYDVMTREFRDSAACAVFVVKTDNLFFEQVFAEFNELLDIFSRIFIVINLDSGKRDLLPDGTLRPSAESLHPEKVIEAFKTLSMAGLLRRAYEEGRVRLHAVDLLSAASAQLSQNDFEEPQENPQKEAFDGFLQDLTDYLNSTDYSAEFIRDSLRQGQTLCAEARNIFEGDEISRVHKEQTEIERQLRDLDERLAIVERLSKVSWDSTFDVARADVARRAKDEIAARSAQLWKEMRASTDLWYGSDDCLQALAERFWNPLLVAAGQELAAGAAAFLKSSLATTFGGAEPPAALMAEIHRVGFTFTAAAQTATAALAAGEAEAPYHAVVQAENVFVKKTLLDTLLCRSLTKIQKQFFGERLDKAISSSTKHQRLPEQSRETLLKQVEDIVREKFPALPSAYCERLLKAYIAGFQTAVGDGLRELHEQLAQEKEERTIPYRANEEILASARELHECAGAVAAALEEISGSARSSAGAAPPVISGQAEMAPM